MMKNLRSILAGLILIVMALLSAVLLWDDGGFTPASPTVCECTTCDTCETQLSNASCGEVRLTADITDHAGDCIDDPAGFADKIFDCRGHTIDGDDTGAFAGIYLNGALNGNDNVTVKNCVITDFKYNLYFHNLDGITLNNNSLCSSVTWDIIDAGSTLSKSGDNNTCDTTEYWDDDGGTDGCSYICSDSVGTCRCWNCSYCESRLNDPSCTTVNLNDTITNHSGTCINNPANFSNKVFDCQGNTIDGDDTVGSRGIYAVAQNITIKNCVITDFGWGILGSKNNDSTITDNNISSTLDDCVSLVQLPWRVLLSRNIISDCGDQGLSGVVYNTTVTYNTVSDCLFDGGIRTIPRENSNISYNVVTNSQYGLWFSGGGNSTVSYNNISNCEYAGMRIASHTPGEGYEIHHNVVNNCSNGFYFEEFPAGNINLLNDNVACNSTTDINLFNVTMTGDNNTCDTTSNWNDTGTYGCTSFCGNYSYYNWTVRYQSDYYQFPSVKNTTFSCSVLDWQCEPAYQKALLSRPIWRVYNNKTNCTLGSLHFSLNESCEGVTLKVGKDKYYWMASNMTTNETEIGTSGIAYGDYQGIYVWADYQNPPETCDPTYQLRVGGSC